MSTAPKRDVVVVGASAGGIEALRQLFREFPGDYAGSIFVVVHLWPEGTSVLPDILRRVSPLPASHPKDGDPVEPGKIYVAPPDHHLMLRDSKIRVVRGPRENRHRPAVDPLFRSASIAYGSRVAGVVLSGNLNDGTAGLIAIKKRGGLAIVQDPKEALYPGMPQSALDHVEVDHVLDIKGIRAILLESANGHAVDSRRPPGRKDLDKESKLAMGDTSLVETDERPGKPSVYACPDCHGTLWELEEDKFLRYRCRVGHSYTADVLEAQMDEGLERALWIAVRALEEAASLQRRLADTARERRLSTAGRHEENAEERAEAAKTIRRLFLKGE